MENYQLEITITTINQQLL